MEEPLGTLEFSAGAFRCSLTWSAAGIRRLSFRRRRSAPAPEAEAFGAPLPPYVRTARQELVTYFSGWKPDFHAVPLDLEGYGDFSRSVYRTVGRIPYGRTLSYADVAERVGNRRAARAVGMCMKKNPVPILIPCHRVIRGDGRAGGFSSPGGAGMKVLLLRMEGAARR